MTYPDDPRRAEAAAMPIDAIADRLDLAGLRREGHELVGPCPQCGGRDRFGINLRKGLFLCRRCEARGDGIGLVMHVRGCTFPQALDWLCGPRDAPVDAAERAARAARMAENRRRQEARGDAARAEAIRQAQAVWRDARPAEGTPVRDYLALRGIGRDLLPALPPSLRFAPALPLMVEVDGPTGRPQWRVAHRGPAMVAGIQGPDRALTGVHRTWLDLSQPKGKARVRHPVTDEPLPAKKVLGSKKGGAVRLTPPSLSGVLVMGEGIETTLTAQVAAAIDGAAYWCGVDLGNMAGRKQAGPGLRFAGLPDLADPDAFVPPPWVNRLVYVMDGDSDPRDTRSKLEAGLRRAMALRPGLKGQIVHAGTGRDLNDVLLEPIA